MRTPEPAADLAVLMAIVSSLKDKPLPPKLVVFGEVGLAGEVRPVQRGQERLREAAKLGFTHALIPKANKPRQAISGMEVMAVERVAEADDRRMKRLQLTECGADLMRRRREARVRHVSEVLAFLLPNDREAMLLALRALLNASTMNEAK